MPTNYKYIINSKGLHISKGNSKIGPTIWSFATVPGNSDHIPTLKDGTSVSNVTGTCGHYCDGCAKNGACYAWRDFMLHHNVTAKAWSENTNLLRSGNLFEEIDGFISKMNKNPDKIKVKTFRINTSGEIENLDQLEGWNNLAIKHPEVTFAVYTKAYDVVDAFLSKHDDTAQNFVINISQWNHVADEFLAKWPGKFNVFEYDETNRRKCTWPQEDRERLSLTKHCPAVMVNGHHAKTDNGDPITCDMCQRCYRKTGKITAVYSH